MSPHVCAGVTYRQPCTVQSFVKARSAIFGKEEVGARRVVSPVQPQGNVADEQNAKQVHCKLPPAVLGHRSPCPNRSRVCPAAFGDMLYDDGTLRRTPNIYLACAPPYAPEVKL